VPSGSVEKRTAKKLGDVVGAYLKPDAKILNLGCGNSDMSAKMYINGFEQIVNIDISEKLLQNLRQAQEKAMPKMQWLYMNASALTFDSESFDVIVDKGTMDAMEENVELNLASVRESFRVLRSGGVMVSISYVPARRRIDDQLKEVKWSSCITHDLEKVKMTQADTSQHSTTYVHVCVKP